MNIVKRLAEPSTWAAIAAVAGAFSVGFADVIPQVGEFVGYIVTGVAGLIAIFTKDPGSPE